MPRKKNYECIVKGCSSLKGSDKSSGPARLHTMRKIWLPKVNRMDLDSLSDADFRKLRLQICNIHFKDRAFTSTFRDTLNRFCEPELFLPNPNADSSSSSSSELVHLHSHVPEYWEFQSLPEDSEVLHNKGPMLVSPAGLAAVTIYSSSSEDEGNNSSDGQFLEAGYLDARLAASIPAHLTPELASFLNLGPAEEGMETQPPRNVNRSSPPPPSPHVPHSSENLHNSVQEKQKKKVKKSSNKHNIKNLIIP